jgi:hypothetical protein
MTTELDRIAKKQAKQRIDKAQKKLSIKRHNIRAAQKAHMADPDREDHWSGYGLKSTEKSKSLHKELRKNEKTDAWMDKMYAKVDKGKSIITDLEKKDIIKKGFPSKAKIGSTKKVYANAYKKKNK